MCSVASAARPAVAANQNRKRAQIIDAARVVLARDGLSGITARSIADAGPLSKSAVHYYFDDLQQIVDLAVTAHLDAMLDSLRSVATDYRDPDQRLRAVLRAYLDTFAEKPYAAHLWFEYWIDAGRRDSPECIKAMLAKVETLLRDLLTDTPTAQPADAARSMLSWLLGTVVQQHVRPLTAAQLDAEIAVVVSRTRVNG